MKSKPNILKTLLTWIARLLTVARYLPFLGKYRDITVALAAIVAALLAAVEKCDSSQVSQPPIQSSPTQAPTILPSTPTHTPSPTPPSEPEIIIDRIPEVGWPFTVRYTAPFKYNTYLWLDKWKLQVMGQEYKTGFMVAPAVVLNSGGRRRLQVRDLQGNVLAEKWIEVK